jgi:hypothetical protein
LADVRAARRTLSAKFEPPVLFYVAWAAVFALLCGSRSLLLSLVGAAALPAASVAATWWQAQAVGRSAYRRHLRALQRPSRVSNAQPLVAADEIPN